MGWEPKPLEEMKAMLLEERYEEQSAFQATDIESNEMFVINANQIVVDRIRLETKKGSNFYSCGRAYPHNGTCPTKGKE